MLQSLGGRKYVKLVEVFEYFFYFFLLSYCRCFLVGLSNTVAEGPYAFSAVVGLGSALFPTTLESEPTWKTL